MSSAENKAVRTEATASGDVASHIEPATCKEPSHRTEPVPTDEPATRKADSNRLKKIITVALLVCIEIILTRFCSINTTFVRFGFGFIPVAVTGMLFGPLWAGGAAAMGDFLGAILFPTGPYFPGFTLTAFITGAIYGLFLYGYDVKRSSYGHVLRGFPLTLRTVIAVLLVTILCDLCLNTVWLSILYQKAYMAYLFSRVLKTIIMTPVQIILLRLIQSRVHLIPHRIDRKANLW
ncbi:MAG: folate family ECF transporter S component [Lachnospiraceae bacterium]|jgi:ECF transporter S component (folate family)|nr:folate family ECF transporter S component [Lachnospiraceae bacterium]